MILIIYLYHLELKGSLSLLYIWLIKFWFQYDTYSYFLKPIKFIVNSFLFPNKQILKSMGRLWLK